MSAYDEESLLADVKGILVAKLNTKIVAVETEKVAEGFPATSLAQIDTTNGYLQQNLSAFPLTISPALFFGLDTSEPQNSPGPTTVRKVKVFAEVLVIDTQADKLMATRINRYARSIREVIEENWDALGVPFRMKVDAVQPILFKNEASSSEDVWVGGVTLTVFMM